MFLKWADSRCIVIGSAKYLVAHYKRNFFSLKKYIFRFLISKEPPLPIRGSSLIAYILSQWKTSLSNVKAVVLHCYVVTMRHLIIGQLSKEISSR